MPGRLRTLKPCYPGTRLSKKCNRADCLALTVVELRKLLLLPLDDLLVIVREFIHPEATRSGIHRTLRRHGVSNLNALLRAENEEAQPAKRKTFKDYAPGFVHVDVKYLPQMADEPRRKYLFVAIDRATRWVYGPRKK